jgi:stage III sporulation protein AF
MEPIREYLLSVSVAAMFCAVARRLLERKGTPAAMGKLLTGLFMTFTVLSPLTDLSIGPLRDFTEDFRQQAQQAVQEGEAYANSSLRKGISERTKAYILDKAEAFGADLQVDVILSDDLYPVPEQVRLSGNVSPYAKMQLKKILVELGISEENQIWT